MTRCIWLIGLLIVAALAAPGVASGSAWADQVSGAYALITQMNPKRAPYDACAEICADIALAERNALGPVPASPLYRLSAAQAEAVRDNRIDIMMQGEGVSEADAEHLVPSWEQVAAAWRDTDPKGDYRLNDAADVLAKYWLFAWMFGGGIAPDKVAEPLRAAVRSQAHHLFQADPVLKNLTEGQRQGFVDRLIRAQAGDIMALNANADSAQLGPVMNEIVAQFEREFDLDLLKLGLTPDQGFVLRASQ